MVTALTNTAYLSLTKIDNRLKKTFSRFKTRRNPPRRLILFFYSLAEIEAEQFAVTASARVTAPGNKPSHSLARGCSVSIDSAPGFLFPRLSDTGVFPAPGPSIKAPQANAPNVPCGASVFEELSHGRR